MAFAVAGAKAWRFELQAGLHAGLANVGLGFSNLGLRA